MRCHRGGISIGIYDPFYFPGGRPSYWTRNLDYFTDYISELGYHEFKNGRQIKVTRYKDYFDVDSNYVEYPTAKEYFAHNGFGMDSKIDELNKKLAPRNHRRTIRVMKDMLGADYQDPKNQDVNNVPNYDSLKYAILSALSDCENYTELMPVRNQKGIKLTPRSAEEVKAILRADADDLLLSKNKDYKIADDLHQSIRKRVGALRKLKDKLNEMYSGSPYEAFYHDTQTRIVLKLYYVLLYYVNVSNWDYLNTPSDGKDLSGVERTLLNINLNPIKMAWHPSWAGAHIVEEMLKNDSDFSELLKIGEARTVDYLLALSGVEPNDPSIEVWKTCSSLIPKERERFLNTPRDEFNTYCSNIKKAYCDKVKEANCQ
jgi:hypothetical protein